MFQYIEPGSFTLPSQESPIMLMRWDGMKKRESRWEALQGGAFLKGSAAGLSELLLGWRSLSLGCAGTLGGFIGALTNKGVTTQLTLTAIGCASLALASVSMKYMKHQQNDRNARRGDTDPPTP